MINNLN